MVVLKFAQTADMDSITVDMREKLNQIEGAWSDSVGNPIIMKLNPDMMPVMVAALEGGDLCQSELTDLVENEYPAGAGKHRGCSFCFRPPVPLRNRCRLVLTGGQDQRSQSKSPQCTG